MVTASNSAERDRQQPRSQKLKQDIFPAVKGSWVTWIPAHTINFAFVPSDMRLLYINTIQIFFNMFMSVIGNTEAVAAE